MALAVQSSHPPPPEANPGPALHHLHNWPAAPTEDINTGGTAPGPAWGSSPTNPQLPHARNRALALSDANHRVGGGSTTGAGWARPTLCSGFRPPASQAPDCDAAAAVTWGLPGAPRTNANARADFVYSTAHPHQDTTSGHREPEHK